MDYSDLGFKCGLEVHQRLNTKKLFCECHCDPNRGEAPEATQKIRRKLRAVVGELGKYDPAAAFEASKGKNYLYIVDDETSCAVEADEEPPHKMNPEALKIVLTASKMLDSKILDTIFVMRKTVIDGSAVSGFQRTCLVALDGTLPTSKGQIGISTIAIEEESAGILEAHSEGEVAYRLDRLGIPLIEIATTPSIKDGAHAMEVAEKLGQLLRSTGKVQRGLGSIRQDLNISIARGARVEIKGVQDLKLIPKLVENEVRRQINLLKLRERINEKHILLGEEHFSVKEITQTFSNTGCRLIKEAQKRNEKVFAMKLIGLSGLFKEQMMPSLTFGSEVAGYVRSHTPARGIIHSDENLEEKYGLGVSEINAIESELNLGDADLFVICMGPERVCHSALKVAFERCMQIQKGVPEETRKAEGEFSVFLRPLPGSARMYPETDLAPIRITEDMLTAAENGVPEPLEKKKSKYLGWGLSEQIAEKMLRSSDWERFEQFCANNPKISQIVAVTLLETIVSLRREGIRAELLSDSDFQQLFDLYLDSKIAKPAIPELIKLKCANYSLPFIKLAEENSLLKFSGSELKQLLLKTEGSPEKKFAEILKTHRLRVDALQLRQLLEGK
ncbi:MAG: Glu-tRNA(Gln) amidotransferase subunit GatE [Candidatus Micrarchaeota archaeon]